jgi:hypothetical protein
MDIFEIEQEETVSRKEVASRLRRLANMLAGSDDVEFERGGMHSPCTSPTRSSSRPSSRSRPTSASWRSS